MPTKPTREDWAFIMLALPECAKDYVSERLCGSRGQAWSNTVYEMESADQVDLLVGMVRVLSRPSAAIAASQGMEKMESADQVDLLVGIVRVLSDVHHKLLPELERLRWAEQGRDP